MRDMKNEANYTINQKYMRRILQKILKYKLGENVLYILFSSVVLIGIFLFSISKLIRAFGLLLMGNKHSAKEEITQWDVLHKLRN